MNPRPSPFPRPKPRPKPYPKTWSRELKISLYAEDARKERLAADLEKHTVKREALSWLGNPIAVGVIDIPIWQPQSFTQEQKTEMTTAEKLTFIKHNLPLAAQVNGQSAAHSNKFDPRRMFSNVSVNVVYPARDDFSDDRVNTDDDGETSESHRVGYASDLLNCEVSGESGAGCSHGNIDHLAKAAECLRGAMADDAQRKRNLNDAAKTHSVRFAS